VNPVAREPFRWGTSGVNSKGAVGPQESQHFAALDRRGGVVHDGLETESFRQMLDLDLRPVLQRRVAQRGFEQ
jgi:hypothetical protein